MLFLRRLHFEMKQSNNNNNSDQKKNTQQKENKYDESWGKKICRISLAGKRVSETWGSEIEKKSVQQFT